ncbi:5-dehydro-2-deoxygluconokinase [Arachnia propionica]|uniref:5-dehydro-2-deoxygluconokinase n=1 Tax=Arachnia propionica TaxID=1750 RepID=A0A3P1WQJ0_9ACTN|nr:5-dehydro-2-deoxygluconokinase [Arachnia propionica]RRD48531.1 5-dehydro-2-deoxygluconokinase [Arachnia propionica]
MDEPLTDVCTIGRCGVDLYPLEMNTRLEDVTRFGKFLGGSATNVAVAAARLGHTACTLTGVGDDPFGRFVRAEMTRLGVDASHVVVNPSFNTPVTFCEVFPPDHFPLFFYRQPTTPDLEISIDDLPDEVTTARILWLTLSGFSVEPSRSAHHEALRRRAPGGLTVLDLDHRPRFWTSEEEASQQVAAALDHVDVAIGNLDECRIAVGKDDPDEAARALLDRGVRIAIVKQGLMGTLARTVDERVYVPATNVRIRNGLGAGDGFGGAVCHGLLSGWSLADTIAFASAAGAIVASRLECSTAMPRADEVERLMDSNPHVKPVVSRPNH